MTRLRRILDFIQISELRIAFWLSWLAHRGKVRNAAWILGTDEIASVLSCLRELIDESFAVNLSENTYSSGTYDFQLKKYRRQTAIRLAIAPLIFGWLLATRRNVLYMWKNGFLENRQIEFRFLEKKKREVVQIFCGDDIRNIALQRRIATAHGRDSFTNYWPYPQGTEETHQYDATQEELANLVKRYAKVVFNAPVCQSSVTLSESNNVYTAHAPFVVRHTSKFLEDEIYEKEQEKLRPLVLIHAPSAENIKGTMLVRAAINSLKRSRDDFVYKELLRQPHERILWELNNADICLNQFHTFGIGVFGFEAMNAGCAVLMSADPSLEPSIPPWLEDEVPWIITQAWEIQVNLEKLLDQHDLRKRVRTDAFRYMHREYSSRSTFERIANPLRQNQILIEPRIRD